MSEQTYKPMVAVGVGAPAWIYLNQFGRIVNDAFGDWPYLVGSAAQGKTWRDVDVRLILADDEYEKLIGKLPSNEMLNPRWRALCMAFSALGQHMTGLPIDFQIQQQTQANKLYSGGVRQALILTADFDKS
jgi:hypothetical protein